MSLSRKLLAALPAAGFLFVAVFAGAAGAMPIPHGPVVAHLPSSAPPSCQIIQAKLLLTPAEVPQNRPLAISTELQMSSLVGPQCLVDTYIFTSPLFASGPVVSHVANYGVASVTLPAGQYPVQVEVIPSTGAPLFAVTMLTVL